MSSCFNLFVGIVEYMHDPLFPLLMISYASETAAARVGGDVGKCKG